MKLARRAQGIGASPTLAMNARAKEMKKQGIDILSFTVGEPDFDTPEHIAEAGITAIREGFTRYTPAAGIPELKEAICVKLKRENGLDYDPADVVVSNGAKHAIYNALQALIDEGDEVIIPAPYWVSYTEMVKLNGGVPVVVPTRAEDGFKLTPSSLKAAITPRTKAIFINSPNNPTGAVYSRAELEALAEILVAHGIVIIADEVYEKLLYDGATFTSVAALGPEVKDLTVTINGVSKTYAMTGWRIGYAAAPRELAQAMANIQSHATSNPNSIAQKAAVAALMGPQEPVRRMLDEFARRRERMVAGINALPGFKCRKPEGAFYIFADVSELFGRTLRGQKITGSVSLAELLLVEAHVAVVPGAAFGDDRYVRFSYATSMASIEKGLVRLKEVLAEVR
ncbi:MAG: aspartate aminotransferase [Bacillota bacterium]|jgi:aspartate aminotransferase|nr:aspartate aminotransferase [Bacillota bacterium]MDK2855859.1 aspartate aminotransferase [Bacillota bacterium]MDK2883080.1 aspartate aminotransferase [Bacillota bacterium]MDK2925145.1 aspartate aminotransferase [Bacillota bacterium]